MELFIGSADSRSYDQALSWIGGSPEGRRLFEPVCDWLISQDNSRGPTALFAEVDLPGNGSLRTEQIDLLIAFRDRAVVCELKLNRQRKNADAVDESLDQLNRKLALVKRHLQHIAPEKVISGILLYPYFSAADIAAQRKDAARLSFHHLTIAGGLQCANHQVASGDRPFDFLQAAESCFHFAGRALAGRQINGLQDRLISKIAWLPRVRRYPSLSEAVDNLKSLTSRPRTIFLATTHVTGLRDSALDGLAGHLATSGCIEVTGPVGSGKSAVIREALAREEERAGRALSLVTRDRIVGDVADVARNLLESLGQDPEGLPDDELVLAELLAMDATIWFRRANPPGASIAELADRVMTATDRRLRLIVESTTPLLPEAVRLVVPSLTPNDIYQILLKQPPSGHSEPDVNRISRSAQGNPALAIAHWRSRAPDGSPDRTGDLQWINTCFDPFEMMILRLVVVFMRDAPLGLTPTLLSTIACDIYKHEVPLRTQEALDTILSQLHAAQLLHIDRLSREFIHAATGASTDDFVVISNVDASLVQFITASMGQSEVDEIANRITAVLIDRHSTAAGSVAEVTASLRMGEVWPFCQSIFRYTHRGGVLAWLDFRAVTPSSHQRTDTDVYLERAIHLQQRMFRYPQEPINLGTLLGEPTKADAKQRYMWDALRCRHNCFLLDGQCDLDSWRQTTEELTDYNLAAQAKASLSKGLQLSGDVDGGWKLISRLYDALGTYDTTTQAIIYFHLLSFLNRRKSIERLAQFRNKTEVAKQVRRYASEALRLALKCENVTMAASTVFYLTKAQETVDPPRTEESLSAYLAALRFVEHASPIRALR